LWHGHLNIFIHVHKFIFVNFHAPFHTMPPSTMNGFTLTIIKPNK
jgi:hypothetical protein